MIIKKKKKYMIKNAEIVKKDKKYWIKKKYIIKTIKKHTKNIMKKLEGLKETITLIALFCGMFLLVSFFTGLPPEVSMAVTFMGLIFLGVIWLVFGKTD